MIAGKTRSLPFSVAKSFMKVSNAPYAKRMIEKRGWGE